ncbi:hypothetical protein Aau02nite_20000 [Amorphoplanes auranticolor]|uniref:Uncharacterized protein n=1 Tax=Actinoplanes auranticolor TaxID=47988 RepID=A0A919VJV3_9ACTN|nr:hypothetical protein Aau02nite_20000 [Actinoplanes auranticolor]
MDVDDDQRPPYRDGSEGGQTHYGKQRATRGLHIENGNNEVLTGLSADGLLWRYRNVAGE